MKNFPKKYTPKELRERSKLYRENLNKNVNDIIFSYNTLPSSKKLSYLDFFQIYIKDFFNYQSFESNEHILPTPNKNIYEQLFIVYWNQLENLCSSFKFFEKRNQTLLQIWPNKLERYILSLSKKNINVNNKILESYSSSKRKIYLPDSELYIYVIEQLRSLWNKWKIINKTEIWYRSFNLQTSIPDDYISWKEENVPYYVLKYFVWTKGDALYIRIEWDIDVCCWDVAILVHPKDKRYNKYIWKNVIVPLCNRSIPVIWDETVNIAKNDWIKRVCPCSDEESIMLAKKHWLPTDIYVFDKKWLYTNYIHEPAFIWQERKKYYENILWFFNDIWNLQEKWKFISKVPYLDEINERLTPYKISHLIIDIEDEKGKIKQKIIWDELKISFLNNIHWNIYKEKNEEYIEDFLENKENDISKEIENYLPNSFICNSQISFWRKIPFIENEDGNLEFLDLEKSYSNQKNISIQNYFDFCILSLVRSWAIKVKELTNEWNEWKLCEYDKLPIIITENEKKIQYITQYFSNITWDKKEFNNFSKFIENISDKDTTSTNELYNLLKQSKYIKQEWKWLLLDKNLVPTDTINPDFIEMCIPCYLYSKNIKVNKLINFGEDQKNLIIKELIVQELLLWKTVSNEFLLHSYNKNLEFLWNNSLNKKQLEQEQWNIFRTYWENPVRLCLLTDKTFNQKEILLNNYFLKQIRNATRLCIQKDFLPINIEESLNNEISNLNDFDMLIVGKLKVLYNEWYNINNFDDFIKFFKNFKEEFSQSIFFSRYLETQKVNNTKNVQFICSYFFSFLLTILYPLVPEFVDALQYISERSFIKKLNPITFDFKINYDTSILYTVFSEIKKIKIQSDIKQHEDCILFIKTTPALLELFIENEQLFKNYFHISEIIYVKLHETNPLWYEIYNIDNIVVWIKPWKTKKIKEKDTLEFIEKEIKNLDDKLNLLRQRLPFLEWEQRTQTEKEYAKTKKEIENLTIKYSLLSSK